MYEMKYLTEADMPYFRRLAKEGKAVIIELSDQALFNMDLDNFRIPSGEIDREKLEEVLRKEDGFLKAKAAEGKQILLENSAMEKILENEPENAGKPSVLTEDESGQEKDIMEKLSTISIPEEKMDAIIEAIGKGATDEEIKLCLNPNFSADQMRKLTDALIQRRHLR